MTFTLVFFCVLANSTAFLMYIQLRVDQRADGDRHGVHGRQADQHDTAATLSQADFYMHDTPLSPAFVKALGPAYNGVINAIRIMLKQVIPFVEFPSH